MKLFEREITLREERKTYLLLKSTTLPNKYGKPFDWKDIELSQGITQTDLLEGAFINRKENLIFLWWGWRRKYLFIHPYCIKCHTPIHGKRVKFYTIASLVNQLLEANEKGALNKFF